MHVADMIEAALNDAEAIVRWAEPNGLAREDERVDAAVQRALGGPVPDKLRGEGPDDPRAYLPLLRFANVRRAALPLLDAMVSRPRMSEECDLCGVKALWATHRLVVPAGMSAVAVYCCSFDRQVLQDVFACGLVWD